MAPSSLGGDNTISGSIDLTAYNWTDLQWQLKGCNQLTAEVYQSMLVVTQFETDKVVNDPDSYKKDACLNDLNPSNHQCQGALLMSSRCGEGVAVTRVCNEYCFLTREAYSHLLYLDERVEEINRLMVQAH